MAGRAHILDAQQIARVTEANDMLFAIAAGDTAFCRPGAQYRQEFHCRIEFEDEIAPLERPGPDDGRLDACALGWKPRLQPDRRTPRGSIGRQGF